MTTDYSTAAHSSSELSAVEELGSAGDGDGVFAGTIRGQKLELNIPCEKQLIISQHFFGIPPFHMYALGHGIHAVPPGAKFSPPPESQPNRHLELLLAWQSQQRG